VYPCKILYPWYHTVKNQCIKILEKLKYLSGCEAVAESLLSVFYAVQKGFEM